MAQSPLAIGCDVGGTNIKVVIFRGRRILERGRHPTPARASRDDTIRAIAAAVSETARELLPPASRGRRTGARRSPPPATLGVALPGFLDGARSRPIFLSNLPALNGAPLRSQLRRRLGLPVILDVDSNAGAYGEARLGSGRGAGRLLYVTLGTGVGAAMVAGGEIVRVSHHTVGSVAHLPLDPEGPRCSCGARGCVESVLGAGGIRWRARRAARAGADLPADARRSPHGLWDAARDGSRDARRLLAQLGSLLGAALAMLSNFLSPDRIVVGGGISQAGDLLLEPARRSLKRRVHPRLRNSLEVAPAGLGPHAGAMGAALLGSECLS